MVVAGDGFTSEYWEQEGNCHCRLQQTLKVKIATISSTLLSRFKLFWDQTSSQPGHQAPPSLLEVKSLPPTLQENGCVWQLCHRKQIGLIFLTQIEPARCFWHAGISFFSIVRASIGRGGSSWAGLAADLKTYHIRASFSRYIRLIPPPNQDRIP